MFGNVALVVLLAFTSCALGDPEDALYQAARSKCMQKNKLEKEFGQQANSNDSRKCFAACILKSHGLLTVDGIFDIEKAVADLPLEIPDRDRVAAAIKKCGRKTGEDECETAHLVRRCLVHKFAFVLPGETRHYLLHRNCMIENNIKFENFRRILWSDGRKKCYDACVMKGRGHFKQDGTFDTETAIADLPLDLPNYDRVVTAITECGNATGTDECETAHLVKTCIINRLNPSYWRWRNIGAILTKCMEQNVIKSEDLSHIPWDDKRKKCFTACVMKERGNLRADGTYDFEKSVENLPQDVTRRDEIIKALYECSTIKSDNECQTAFLISTCLRAQLSSLWRQYDHAHNGL
ncbi:uncharacterized protein [Venturia canescens]|uniref:uncharacterized protein n=1 Tax=Venturia canescens TaxID=32260 RepID=UPI001C9C6745|nr:uncharacterized protein LOC122406178 [Venturia canescens]